MSKHARGRRGRPLLGPPRLGRLLALVAVGCLGLAALYVNGGGPLPLWASRLGPPSVALRRSTPEEVVLRTLRLAGFERAAVGSDEGAVVVRLEVPSVQTAADIDLSWQTALAAGAAAFPRAGVVSAQLYSVDRPLLQVEAARADVLAATNATALRRDAEFSYLVTGAPRDVRPKLRSAPRPSFVRYVWAGLLGRRVAPLPVSDEMYSAGVRLSASDPVGARMLPKDALSIDDGLPGALLDAKNDACGLHGQAETALVGHWSEARLKAGGKTPGLGADKAKYYARRAAVALRVQTKTAGSARAQAAVERAARSGSDTGAIAWLKGVALAAESVGTKGSYATVTRDTAAVAGKVAARPVPSTGVRAGVALVAAGQASSPEDLKDVARFRRRPSLDSAAAPGRFVPGALKAPRQGGRVLLRWTEDARPASARTSDWRAYERRDETVYWQAEAGPRTVLAVTDASLRGWAFSIRRAYLVDS